MQQLPKAFLEQMQQLLDNEVELENFLHSFAKPNPVSIRYNTAKSPEMPTALSPVPWASWAFYLPKRPNFTADPLLHAGAYYVQEASSMFLEQALRQTVNLDETLRVLDLCAAPGGKSTLISNLLNDGSLLLSNEVIRSRAHILSENIQKWGRANIWVSQNDPETIGKVLPSFFDVIVVDAPCSGEGMFRKSANSIEEWSPQVVQHCALRQQRILHDIWNSLRPGGVLIYSTCTYNEQENEKNLLKFRADCDFESLPLKLDPSWNVAETTNDGLFAYRFYLHKTQGEGFFLSILRKAGNADTSTLRIKKPAIAKADKEAAEWQTWAKNPEQWQWAKKNEQLLAIPASLWPEVQALESHLNIVYGGAVLAEATRKGFNPLPSAALWVGLQTEVFPSSELELHAAQRYLRLDSLSTDELSDAEGWQLVKYKGLNLGWVKKMQQRVNNYFPKEWKIRLSIDKLR